MANAQNNPWLQIWTKPRKSLRTILNTNPHRWVLLLAILGGILSAISFIFALRSDTPFPQSVPILTIVAGLIVGAIVGIIHLYFGGWLYRLTGSWIGGKGTFTDVKCAVGWSNYPFIIASILSIIGFLTARYPWLQLIFGLLNLVVAIWGLIIFLNFIAEAHQFSFWKGLLAVLIALALIFVVVVIIALIIPLLNPLFQ